jgi:hypothetical protein
MSKIKATLIGALVVASVATTLVVRNESKSRVQRETLQQQMSQLSADNAHLSNQLAEVSRQREVADANARTMAELAAAQAPKRSPADSAADTADGKGRAKTNKESMLNDMISSPDMRKLIRDQQKSGMEQIYKEFAKQANLSTNQAGKLTDVLADDIMDNIDQVTKVIREGKSVAEINQVFTEQEAMLREKVRTALGDEDYAKYREYTHNLLGNMTADQFKEGAPKDKPLSDEHANQLRQVLVEETQAAILRAGLDPEYQTVPVLNFRNFASEQMMNRSLELVDEIYANASTRAADFLSPDDLTRLGQFRANVVKIHRAAITMNRQMMSPAK